MLHQFTFGNYKSFRNIATLDLLASPITEHKSDVATDCYEEQVLKVAAIYGANASGKSNVIKAFRYMREYIMFSFINNQDRDEEFIHLETDWFKFDDNEEPSNFEVLFSAGENIYNYGFVLLKNKILEEFLYVRDNTSQEEDYKPIFIREKNVISDIDDELKVVTPLSNKILSENMLFLSFAANLDVQHPRKVYEWFISSKVVDYGHDTSERLMINYKTSPLVKFIKDKEQKISLLNFIKAIDVGIEDIGLVENEIFTPTGTETRYQIITYHKHIKNNNHLIAVPLSNESSGTKKMISMFIPISRALTDGSLLIVDELDAKLHPLLLRYLVILFHSKKSNPKNAQLIFATHDVFTLDKSNFRRDEIWFVDKNENGISELYSLASYLISDDEGKSKKVRKDASYGKDYILGKYKSIPRLKSLSTEDFNAESQT